MNLYWCFKYKIIIKVGALLILDKKDVILTFFHKSKLDYS